MVASPNSSITATSNRRPATVCGSTATTCPRQWVTGNHDVTRNHLPQTHSPAAGTASLTLNVDQFNALVLGLPGQRLEQLRCITRMLDIRLRMN